jgi:hypothetical protein
VALADFISLINCKTVFLFKFFSTIPTFQNIDKPVLALTLPTCNIPTHYENYLAEILYRDDIFE